MAPKVPSPAIGLSDVKGFLKTEADFAFEMRTLHRLRSTGFQCEHAGGYTDPITGKRRQFDIRATRLVEQLELRLAVEAKNLRDTSPLVIHMVERTTEESFNDIIVRDPLLGITRRVQIKSYESAYRPDEFVGKGTDQVTRKGDGSFGRSDADVWEKFGQAMNSARDLIEDAVRTPHDQRAFAIVPVVVVPDQRLWQVRYHTDGSQVGDPEQVAYCPYFINFGWDVGSPTTPMSPYVMSHLEVVTLSALKPRMDGQFYRQGGVFSVGRAVFNR